MSDNTQSALHAGTPVISAGPRTLAFLRHPDEAGTPARILATRTLTAPLTRTVRAFGARPLDNAGTGSADAVTVITLSGQPLLLHTADGDITLTLSDAAGRPLWGLSPQGTAGRVDYEPDDGAGRPLALTEQPAGGSSRMREQYAYAAFSDAALKACNLAGALTEHRHNAGISRPLSLSVTGLVLLSEERLLTPEAELPDWSVLTEGDTEDALMMSGTGDATGAPLAQMNAAGVTTLSAYDISGTVRETRLTYTEGGDVRETVTLRDILYRADGVVLSQTAGNGVTDTYVYDPRTQRLVRHTTQRPAGHPLGALVISDLHYTYDPAGNILTLDDRGADPAWHNNQQTTGLRTYAYDTLYRLTSATGRERHPVNPDDPTAGQVWSPYTQVYSYDDGDNLTRTVHTGGSGNRTVEMEVSAGSNRAIRKPDGGTTPDPEAGFLAGGLQKALSDGRLLTWHADGQLELVSPVVRAEGETDDTEAYRYSDGGTRVRKIRTTQTSGGTQLAVTTYAGGYELRRRSLAGTLQRDIVITDAGGVRLTEDRLTGETRLRYALTDHLNSQGGEADDSGRLTSREEYLPYGGSAGSDEEAAESHDRTARYSGKERDATGLYYYGWRYYQPETGRWLSADPGGLVDGVNLFRFCRNNPVTFTDKTGNITQESEIKLPETGYRKYAMRYLPAALFNTGVIEKISGYTLRPSVRNASGEYKPSSAFSIKQITATEMIEHLDDFLELNNNIKLSSVNISVLPEKPLLALSEAKINKGKMHSVTTNARDLAENGEGNVFYKMTNKRGILGRLRGESKTTYALSTLKTSGEFKFENVITHPYTQISRLPDEIKEQAGGAELKEKRYDIIGLGKAMSIRTTILASRKTAVNVNSITTQAINERSRRIFTGMAFQDINRPDGDEAEADEISADTTAAIQNFAQNFSSVMQPSSRTRAMGSNISNDAVRYQRRTRVSGWSSSGSVSA